MIPNIPMTQAGIGGLGPWELAIILVIILVVFGAGKLPGIGGSVGQAIKNFKKSISGDSKDASEAKKDDSHKSDCCGDKHS